MQSLTAWGGRKVGMCEPPQKRQQCEMGTTVDWIDDEPWAGATTLEPASWGSTTLRAVGPMRRRARPGS